MHVLIGELLLEQWNYLLKVGGFESISLHRFRFLHQYNLRRSLHWKPTSIPRVSVRETHREGRWGKWELTVKRGRIRLQKRGRRHGRLLRYLSGVDGGFSKRGFIKWSRIYSYLRDCPSSIFVISIKLGVGCFYDFQWIRKRGTELTTHVNTSAWEVKQMKILKFLRKNDKTTPFGFHSLVQEPITRGFNTLLGFCTLLSRV